ncbi:hypothetical protein [Aeromonas salmonicida]|uniref:hypothetical protein n=1 Tax=Aeromonas TaxID=642 RepID=UPI0038E2446D
MFTKTTIFALTSIFLFGCTNQALIDAKKKDEEFARYAATLPEPSADYGVYPENYQDMIKQYMSTHLKDPYSAKYSQFTAPKKEHAMENHKAIYGHSSCVLINAKNSYGAYTGDHLYWFFFKDGEIIRSQDTSTGFNIIYVGRPISC